MRGPIRATLLAVVLAAGCGDDGGLSDTATARLQPQVQALREAAGQGNREPVAQRLAELRAAVEELRAQDEVSDDTARRILAVADDVEAQLALLPTTTTTTTTPLPPDSGDDDDRGRDRDRDRRGDGGEKDGDD